MSEQLLKSATPTKLSLDSLGIDQVMVLGPEGTYLDGLARSMGIGPDAYGRNFTDMAVYVDKTSGTAALLAINNTMDERSIHDSIGIIHKRRLRVIGVGEIDVISNILGLGTLDSATKIAGKDVALEQITSFMLHLERTVRPSTAAAGAEIRQNNDKTMLVVGSRLLATVYGLDVLAESVQDPVGLNITTALIVTTRNGWEFHPDEIDTDAEQYGVMIVKTTDSDKPRALHRITGVFADRELNLKNIDSFNIRGTRDSEFLLTLTGHGAAILDLVTDKIVAENISIDVLGITTVPEIYNSDDPTTLIKR